ncbi:NAC domain-containing protein 83-like [Durio zibethinus]|uniref:NAC domain-containing protein 83-like n=1 Tax=Durio zibethinus TaxID=66656 RepID=A0A6P5X1U1_DURZI|nr:NAC domain-containing protein 83-like [Durio zibethinus]
MLIVSSEFATPPGFRFLPTKEEIFVYYLRPAINGEPLSCNILTEGDIYGENKEPWNLFNKDEKKSFWVFTKLKKKSKSRIDRTAGCGCWLGRNTKEVRNASGQLLGLDKYFTFTCKKDKSSQGNGNWIMHEYSLMDEGFSDYVICEIKNKDVADRGEDEEEPKNKKRKSLEVNDEEASASTMKRVFVDHQGNLNERHPEPYDPSRMQTMTSIIPLDFAYTFGPDELPGEYVNTCLNVDDYIIEEIKDEAIAVPSMEEVNGVHTMTSTSFPDFADHIVPEDLTGENTDAYLNLDGWPDVDELQSFK